MDPLSVAATLFSVVQIAWAILDSTRRITFNVVDYARVYGISGLVLWLLGGNDIWQMQAQVLASLDDDVAMRFRNSIQEECTMKAVAVLGSHVRSVAEIELMLAGCNCGSDSHHSTITTIPALGGSRCLDCQSCHCGDGCLLHERATQGHGATPKSKPDYSLDKRQTRPLANGI